MWFIWGCGVIWTPYRGRPGQSGQITTTSRRDVTRNNANKGVITKCLISG